MKQVMEADLQPSQQDLASRVAVLERVIEIDDLRRRDVLDAFEKLVEARTLDLRHQHDAHATACDQRFEAFLVQHVKNHDKEHEAEQHALDLALQNLGHRLAAMNEWRAQMAATEAKYATQIDLKSMREWGDLAHQGLEDRVRKNESALIATNSRCLGTEFRTATDERFRSLERQVYMAAGAVTIIILIIQFAVKR